MAFFLIKVCVFFYVAILKMIFFFNSILKKTFALRHKSKSKNALFFLDFPTKWTTSLSANDNTAKEYLRIKNWNTTKGSPVSLVKPSFSRENPSHFMFNDFVLVVLQMYWRKKSAFLAPSFRKLNVWVQTSTLRCSFFGWYVNFLCLMLHSLSPSHSSLLPCILKS